MNVFLSPFSNPFINLAIEDYFLRTTEELPVLFFYVNRPCVVMGRFQNPWIECDLSYLIKNDIWLVRRQSGGGTVFHDEGNLNFSFITSYSLIDRRKHAELLQKAFAAADIELSISPRHDLWLKDGDGIEKKISGSAFKQTKNGSFHHGTVLVSSDLDRLEKSIAGTMKVQGSKSIASVRSKVIKLQERYPEIEIPDVVDLVAHYFKAEIQTIESTLLSHPEVQKSFNQLRSQDWLWGETPYFEIEGKSGTVAVKKGKLESNGEWFTKKIAAGLLEDEKLEKLFPDFSEQHRSSNLIS